MALVLAGAPAVKADEGDGGGGLAIATGAACNLVGMAVGGAVLATSHGAAPVNNAGWLTIEGGFTLAPLAAHGVVSEWGRGAVFSAAPAAMMGGTAILFAAVPAVVDYGSLPQQRLMWGLFVAGQLASIVGVIDAAWAPSRRKVSVTPVVGAQLVGVQVGGVL